MAGPLAKEEIYTMVGAAIPVNELPGPQQIVIKALGESFKNIPGLTGGAILPDGDVGMILDVDGLMKCLRTEEARA